MVEYTCPRCGTTFAQKGHYTRHLNKKKPCVLESKVEALIEQKVQEALGHKKAHGQYFTIAKELQDFVFRSVKHKGATLLEPSFGAGHLLLPFLAADPAYPVICYELDTTIKPVLQFGPSQTAVYGDFLQQPITRRFKTIVGNPPYVKQSTGNLYLKFIDRCFELLEADGELIFIVPSDFLKLTSAAPLIERMSKAGAFTDFLFPHNERLFEGASVDVVVFRYEKGALQGGSTKVNGAEKGIAIVSGIITFPSVVPDTAAQTISSRFNVYVGLVSGRDEVYRVPFGNLDVLLDKGNVQKFIYTEKWPAADAAVTAHLTANKETLLGRGIRKFSESNWWEWGAPRNKKAMEAAAGRPCIYVRNITRSREVCFAGTVQYFGGSLLCMIPKADMTGEEIKKVVDWLNTEEFQANYKYSGRFKIGHKQLCCAPMPV